MECELTNLGVTFTQWCNQEGLPQPQQQKQHAKGAVYEIKSTLRKRIAEGSSEQNFATSRS